MNRIARRAAVAASIVLGMLVAAAVAGLPLYVFPPAASVDRADLVYVIGPPTPPRIALAEELETEGVADELLVSVSAPASTTFTANDVAVCTAAGTTCETPDPFTTKGEARLLTQFAGDRRLDETVVITFTPHVARTRYIFDKCYDGDVTVVGVDQRMSLGDWIYQYAYQSAAFVKAFVTPCA